MSDSPEFPDVFLSIPKEDIPLLPDRVRAALLTLVAEIEAAGTRERVRPLADVAEDVETLPVEVDDPATLRAELQRRALNIRLHGAPFPVPPVPPDPWGPSCVPLMAPPPYWRPHIYLNGDLISIQLRRHDA